MWLPCTNCVFSAGLLWYVSKCIGGVSEYAKIWASVEKIEIWSMESWLVPLSLNHRYTSEIAEPAQLLSGHGAQIGSLWGFSRNQNNCGSSGAYVTCIYCGVSVKIDLGKTTHGTRRSWTHLFCIRFCLWDRQKPKDPNLSPVADDSMADDSITQCGTRGLGSPLLICGLNAS